MPLGTFDKVLMFCRMMCCARADAHFYTHSDSETETLNIAYAYSKNRQTCLPLA